MEDNAHCLILRLCVYAYLLIPVPIYQQRIFMYTHTLLPAQTAGGIFDNLFGFIN